MSDDGNIFSAGGRKVLCYPDQVRKWLDGRPGSPVVVEIHPSERCNHRCPDCQSHWVLGTQHACRLARRGTHLDLRLLDSLWERPPEGIIISGHTGEPLMHPQIRDLLLTLERRSIPYAVISNGGRMTEELAAILVRSSRGIRVSLDGHDSISFRGTHGVGPREWRRVLDGVRMLVEARRRVGITRDRCLIGLGYLVGPSTKDGMEKATRLAAGLGVDYIQFRPFHFTDVSVDDLIDSCLDHARSDFSVLISAQKYDLMRAEGWMDERPYAECNGAFFFNAIDARGDIYVCCHQVSNDAAKVGSLRETSWSDWLDSRERYDRIRGFGLERCIPLCRLNALNRVLQALLEGQKLEPPADSLVFHHRMFL